MQAYEIRGATRVSAGLLDPVILRLRSVATCPPDLVSQLEALGPRVEALPARALLHVEDEPVRRPRYLLAGWACRYRHLSDGRKQIYDLVLPGDGVGVCLRAHPLANTSAATLTPARLVDASPLLRPETLERCEALRPALLAQADAQERRMLDQIVRLGRLTAYERLAHLLLDLRDRLEVVGLVEGDRFAFPLTQEMLADIAGLSIVHVNRTLQELRRQDAVRVERGWVRLPDPATLGRMVDYAPAKRTG